MKSIKPSVLFFGTPEFALPTLEALIKNGYAVVGVVTRPDERVGRRQILTPPPVKVTAERRGIPVFQPEILNPARFASEIPQADLFVVAAYGKIIPKAILDIPKLGALNIHPSLLPRWRGPSPIQAAILHSDVKTGVTIMQMDEQMDHGQIVAQRQSEMSKIRPLGEFRGFARRKPSSWLPTQIPISISKITYPELHDLLAKLGAELLIETLPRWIAGEITPAPQAESQATYCRLLTKNDGRIDWEKPAEEIERMIRAYHPWPGSWTIWNTDAGERRIRIEEADAVEDAPPHQIWCGGKPGLVWQTATHPLLIQTGRGSLSVKKLRLEGKSATDAASFLRGHPSIIGSTLR